MEGLGVFNSVSNGLARYAKSYEYLVAAMEGCTLDAF